MHVMGSVRCAGVGGTAVGDTEQVQQPCDELGLYIGIKHKHLRHGTYTMHVQHTTYDISLASILHALCRLAQLTSEPIHLCIPVTSCPLRYGIP